MMQGAPDSPAEVRPGATRFVSTMTETDKERGRKRGSLSTGRAQQLGKTKGDADADAAADTNED